MTHDFQTIEALASRLCHDSGGTWDKKYTKRAHWRKKATEQIRVHEKSVFWPLLKAIFDFGWAK